MVVIPAGEGGAGTWSDGKLTTRIGRNSDPVRQVLQTFVRFGAPENILVAGRPHLGTERLVRILKLFRGHLLVSKRASEQGPARPCGAVDHDGHHVRGAVKLELRIAC